MTLKQMKMKECEDKFLRRIDLAIKQGNTAKFNKLMKNYDKWVQKGKPYPPTYYLQKKEEGKLK